MLVDLINQYSSDNIGASTETSDNLGKNDFLRLLVEQLKNQDPLEPMKNEDFIAQLAQFNSLEQMMNMNKNFEQLLAIQTLTEASSFIGKEVSWYDENGDAQKGVVDSIQVVNEVPILFVGGKQVAVSDIFAISKPPQ